MVFIDDIYKERPGDSLYQGGDINDTILPPAPHLLMTRWFEMTRAMVFIDNNDKEQPKESLYEGGDINDTIPPPPGDDKMVGGDTGNGVY